MKQLSDCRVLLVDDVKANLDILVEGLKANHKLSLALNGEMALQCAHVLAGLAGELKAAGIRVQCVEARSGVRERLRTEGLDERLGGIDRFTSVADVVDNFRKPG